jgi:hypothetical protein
MSDTLSKKLDEANTMENVVKRVNEMSDLGKVRTYNAAKAEFDRISHQRKAIDELAWMGRCVAFHHVADWIVIELVKERGGDIGFFIFDKVAGKSMGEYWPTLPLALTALALYAAGRADTNSVYYAARVMEIK